MTPTDIKLHRHSKTLEVHFPDGVGGTLSAEFLRVHSPSAEVQGHGKPILQTGKRDVGLSGIEPVGNYAVRLTFDDGHDSGLYHWDTLYHFVQNEATLWQSYLDRLAEAGAGRDPGSVGGAQSFTP